MLLPTDLEARRATLWIGALLLITGVLVSVVANITHPSREDPMDNPRVFQEYAESGTWVATHLGQFVGYVLLFGGVIVLFHALVEQRRSVVLAYLGSAMAIASIAVAAILQAIDGIALKAMVDQWVQAAGSDKPAVFAAAEAVRWNEIGVNSLFRLLQGTTLILVGLALALSERYPRWLGWIGTICGLALVLRGFAIAFDGFDLSNPVYAITSLATSNLPITLLNLWTATLAFFMWRRSRQPETS